MQTLKIFIGAVAICLSSVCQSALLSTISADVEVLIKRQHLHDTVQIQHPSNPRLQHLEPCANMQIYNVSGSWLGAVRLQVECDNWKIYWPVQVAVFKPVVQLASDIGSQQTISASDLQYVEQDISKLRQGFFTNLDDVAGRQASRALRAGMILNQRLIQAPTQVARGEKVVILGSKPGLQVSMSGTALEDGALGEQIRVKNLSSGRTIAATVVGEKVVQVTLAP